MSLVVRWLGRFRGLGGQGLMGLGFKGLRIRD